MSKQKYIDKECSVHGLTSFVLEGRGYYRCKKCRSEHVQNRRRKVKQMAVEYKGGQCKICGYNKCIEALEFHHLNPDEKDFALSGDGNTLSWSKVQKEIDKCDLLCANCHREAHTNIVR